MFACRDATLRKVEALGSHEDSSCPAAEPGRRATPPPSQRPPPAGERGNQKVFNCSTVVVPRYSTVFLQCFCSTALLFRCSTALRPLRLFSRTYHGGVPGVLLLFCLDGFAAALLFCVTAFAAVLLHCTAILLTAVPLHCCNAVLR